MNPDFIYANIAAARLELSEIPDPPFQVRDAIKRLTDAINNINDAKPIGRPQYDD